MRPRHAVALAALAAAGCAGVGQMLGASFERPRLTFLSFRPEALDLEGVTAMLHYRVDNPNAVGLKVASLDYAVEVNGHPAVDGSLHSGISVPMRGSAPLDIPIRLRFRDVPGLVGSLSSRDGATFRVTGSVGIDTPIGVVRLPYSASGKVPVARMPHIALAGIGLRSLSFDGLSFEIRIDVSNPNGFALPTGALNYGLRLGGKEVVNAAVHELASVPPGGQARVAIPIRIPFSAAGDAATRLLRGEPADVKLTGEARFGRASLPLDLAGRLAR